jgi:hypothetical protein
MASPEETIDDLREAMADPLGVIADANAGDFLGPATEDFEDLAIALACVHLFERADVDGYARNLRLCGFARRHFLARLQELSEAGRDTYGGASRAKGDLAAFIAGDDALLQDIISRSALARLGGEYEDDYRYRKVLHRLMTSTVSVEGTDLQVLIEAFEDARGGAEASRSELCAAFLDGRQEHFWTAFSALHDDIEAQRSVPPRTDEPWPELASRLWLEGLVWLAVAARLRHWRSPEPGYPLCPSWAKRTDRPPAGEDLFQNLPL